MTDKENKAKAKKKDNSGGFFHQISQMISKNSDPTEFYRELHQELKSTMSSENFYVATIQKEKDEDYLNFPYFVDQNISKELRNFRRPCNQSLSEYVIKTGKPLNLDRNEILELVNRNVVNINGAIPNSWLGVPLEYSGNVFGLIAVQDYDSKPRYSNGDQSMLELIATQLSVAIYNSAQEAVISNQSARLQTIFESSTHLIWSVNSEKMLTTFNNNYYEVFGKENFKDIVKLEQPDGVKEYSYSEFWSNAYDQALQGNQVQEQAKFCNHDGSEVWFIIYLNPIVNEAGHINEISGIAHDITQQKIIEQKLVEAKTEAEKSLNVKDRFLANISHEIKTPLNGIIGILDLFTQTPLSEEQAKYLGIIRNSSETLFQMMNDILDFSTLRAGNLELKNTDFRINELLQQIHSLFYTRALSKQLRFELSESDADTWIHSDRSVLFQIISNLVSNAVKFTPKHGQVTIAAHIDEIEDGTASCLIEVIDNGIGIKAGDIDGLFKDFNPVDSSSTKSYHGAGLGLAISKNLVQLLDGEIGVESEPDEGSRFWFRFHAGIGVKQQGSVLHPGGIPKIDDNPKILLVDDNTVNHLVSGNILKSAGCEVHEATSGQEAIDLVAINDYDLILMDIQMPKMDGIDTTKELKKHNKSLPPVIAMTAYTIFEDPEQVYEHGFTDYISKPIRSANLVDVVVRNLGGNSKNAAAKANPLAEVVVDQGVIEQLRNHCDDESLRIVYSDFCESVKEQLEAMTRYKEGKEYQEILSILHTLKGNTGTLGANHLSLLSGRIEKELKSDSTVDLNIRLGELQEAFDEFEKQIDSFIN